MPLVKDIHGVTQRTRAYDSLRRALTLQRIVPGTRVGEMEWADRLSVDRTAIREALGRLRAEGLVVEGRQRGYFVANLSGKEADDVREVRALLETAAAERICFTGRNGLLHLKPLCEACDELERLLGRDDPADLGESDQRFHELLVAMAGSERLDGLYCCLPLPGDEPDTPGREEWVRVARSMLRDHRAIVAALQRRDLPETRRLLRTHWSRTQVVPDRIVQIGAAMP